MTVPTRICPWSAVISTEPSAVPTVALPCPARSHRSPVDSTSTGPIEHLMRVAPRRPTVRTPPIEPSAVSREPAGSSTRTSTDSLGPMKLKRGFGPVIVSRWPSKSTVVSSAPRRSTALAGLVGVTVTTVSVRSPATTSIAPTGRWMATSIGVGVVYVGMLTPAFLGVCSSGPAGSRGWWCAGWGG